MEETNNNLKAAAETAAQAVERARENLERYSQQPRFSGESQGTGDLVYQVFRVVEDLENQEPPYLPDSRKRDAWLREFIRKEPHLLGVLNSVAQVDKNRGWSLTGGRNQVVRFTDVFHNWEGAPGMIGWRAGMSSAALSFYSSDLGAVIEVGREGKSGPLRGLYHVDPVRCALTGNSEKPLAYYPPRGKRQEWSYDDYMRVVSLPSTDETFKGLGLSAVSRAVELARLMVAIYQHDLEQMGAKAPRGLLLLKGISQDQWNKAMAARDAALAGENYKYFDAVAVLAGGAADVDAKLVALSQLPAGFDRRTFIDLLMFGYALVFGYDPIEFWPVQFGAIGRGNETQIQHDKATGKGGLDFALGWQEQLQQNLPDTLQYDLDQRDQSADLMMAELHKAWGEAINKIGMYLTADEARLLLADHEIIPQEWTEVAFAMANEDTEDEADPDAPPTDQKGKTGKDDEATQDDQEGDPDGDAPKKGKGKSSDQDAERSTYTVPGRIRKPTRSWLKRERDRLRESETIWRAAELFPREPIVRYEWPAHRTLLLWERGDDVFRREVFPSASVRERQVGLDWAVRREVDEITYYDDGEVTISATDVDRAIDEAGRRVGDDLRDALANEPTE